MKPVLSALWSLALPVTIAVAGCGGDAEGSDDSGSTRTSSATQTQGGDSGDTSAGASTGGGSDTATDGPASTTTSETSGPGSTSALDSTGADTTGSNEGGGTIDVSLSGCDVDFGGTVVVSYNGSLGIASVYDGGATLSGSFQFELDGAGTYQLSSQHRVDTGTVVNMVDVAQGTWTNLDADALTGGVDTIGGTLTVHQWDPASGISDLELDGVSLLNVVNDDVCTIDGTIVTTELYP